MFLRAFILAYTQKFHWSLVHLAVFVTVNSRAPCLLTPYTHFGHRQLRPFLVLERKQLLPRCASTNNHAMRFLQWTMSIQLGTVPLCVVVCIPICVGSLNVPCCTSSWALYVYYIRYAEHVAHTPPVGSLPLAQKCLALH